MFYVNNMEKDDFLLKRSKKRGEYGMKTILQTWGQEKTNVAFGVIFFNFFKSICVTSENKTNESEEVTFIMFKIVAVFLDVLPHIP